jgi:nucleoside-diphosphate-sugar epimerase
MRTECASADHPVAVAAIIKGIKSKPAGSAPGFLIHTSGTGILGNPDQEYGTPPDREYDDVNDIETITNFPLKRWHRNVDKLVLEASEGDDPADNAKIKTCIICPPTIYGKGEGPVRVRSVQLPDLANAALRRGGSLTVNKGQNEWMNVHVADLAEAYVLLVEEAQKGGGKADWNAEGYYFVENGRHVWKDLAKAIAEVGFKKGYFKSDKVDILSVEETLKAQSTPHPGPDIWGVNSLGHASRVRSLGWKARKPPIWEYVSEAVDIEARGLGLSI